MIGLKVAANGNGLITLRSIDAENLRVNPPLISRAMSSFISCPLRTYLMVGSLISVACASVMLMNYSMALQVGLDTISAPSKSILTKSVSYKDTVTKMAHANPRVQLTQVNFKRNEEGRYIHEGSPFSLSVADIKFHGDGWIELEDGPRILVEEDAQTITKLIDDKVIEQEKFDRITAKNEALGDPGIEDDED